MMKTQRRFPRLTRAALLAGSALMLTAGAPGPDPEAGKLPQPPHAAGAAPAVDSQKLAKTASLTVAIDQTRTVNLDQPIATISVGNPSIADVNIQNGTLLFLLGRSFGRTNIIGLDARGETVLDLTVFVTQAGAGAVTVYKGNRQVSYNCAPNCERALIPGDSKTEFDELQNQVSIKMSTSQTASKGE